MQGGTSSFPFQSTQPKRAATETMLDYAGTTRISIHAAQEGCDPPVPPCPPFLINFNPRSPRGLRPRPITNAPGKCYFNPRSPRGLRHFIFRSFFCRNHFNPRSPRGLRLYHAYKALGGNDFNPRSPRGLRRGFDCVQNERNIISIHAAQEGCDIIVIFLILQ